MSRPIAVIDCETDPFANSLDERKDIAPFLWCYYNGEIFETFWNNEKGFVEFLKERKEIIYCHNGAGFDYPFLFPYLDGDENVQLINGKILKLQFGEAELRDSLRLLPLALSKIAKDRFDYRLMLKQNREKHKQKIIRYCQRDCRELFNAVERFTEEFGKMPTIGGAAVSQYREIEEKKLDEFGACHYDEFHPFYFGGRTEVYPGVSGKEFTNFVGYDINSAYPWACTLDHPSGPQYIEAEKLPGKRYLPFCFAVINAVSRGALPYRAPGEQTIQYPRDNITRTYHASGHEILAGLETGTLDIKSVETVYQWKDRSYSKTWNARKFVETFFAKKKEAKKLKEAAATETEKQFHALNELLYKLVLNNLYGKLATNGAKFCDYHLTPIEETELEINSGFDYAGNLGAFSIMSEPAMRQPFYDIVAAASITGAVRAKLWRAACECETPLYSDTDSLYCISSGNLDIGKDLGQWDIEGHFSVGVFPARKLYALKHEGVKKDDCFACGHKLGAHCVHMGCGNCDCRGFDSGWKTACKGGRLEPHEIFSVNRGEVETYHAMVPTHSLSTGRRFISRRFSKEGNPLPPKDSPVSAPLPTQSFSEKAGKKAHSAGAAKIALLESLRVPISGR